jgi:hypothetical protein
MEPVTAITTALALGAAAGLKETAEQIFKDGYAALKSLVKRKFPQASPSLDQLEQAPDSKARRAVVEEDLAKGGAAHDVEVLQQAKALLELIEQRAPATASVIGVDLQEIKGGALRISDILSSGTGVRVKGAAIEGEIDIKGVRAGPAGGNRPNP